MLGGSRASDGGSGFDMGKLMLPAIGVGISVAAMAAAYSLSQGSSKKKKGKKDKGPQVTGPKINVYFGSQTGTAEDMAKSLAKEGIKRNFDMKAIDMERFEPLDAAGTNCIFLVATYGEGDPTDNARSCFDWLQDEGKEGDLDGMTYAVFGLGNTQYEHYNSVGTFFDSQCGKLGGQRVVELGLGDDDKDIQEDFNQWKDLLWPALEEHFGLESTEIADQGVEYRLKVSTFTTEKAAMQVASPKSSSGVDQTPTVEMTVTCNRELYSAEAGRSCRHLELDIQGKGVSYETGDHVGIMAANDENLVNALGYRIGCDLDEWLVVEDDGGTSPFPCPCTVRHALTKYLDINGAPKKKVITAMAEAASDDGEKQRLEHLASKKGKEELTDYIVKGRRNFLDVMTDFASVSFSIAQVIELLPRLQPRYYSISSASNVTPVSVHVTAVVVADEMEGGRLFKGVCTNHLYSLPVGSHCEAFCRKTPFKLPKDPSVPVVMVGAGTGLAPMRGMYLHMDHQRREGTSLGESMLVFGCRTSKDDFLYGDEMGQMVENGTITHLVTAFSREVKGERPYVQHRVKQRAADILRMLDAGGHFYVCGLTAMAKDVKKSLIEGMVELRGMTGGEAEAYMEKLGKEGRYMQDVWSS